MRCKFSELELIGQCYDLTETSFIVLNTQLQIKHINNYAKLILGWATTDTNWTNKHIEDVCQSLGMPPLVNKSTFEPSSAISMGQYIKSWQLEKINIDDEEHFFLIDKDVTNIEELHTILKNKLVRITGQTVETRQSLLWYIDEIHHCLESILLQMPGYMYWKDNDFKYVLCNNAVAESLGFSNPYEIKGKTDYDFGWDKNMVDKYRQFDAEIIRTGKPKFGIEETIIVHKGKELNLIVNKMPLFNQNNEVVGIIGVDVDITDRKEAEKLKIENQAHKTSEEEHAKFKAIASQVAHDIRSPLSSLAMLLNECDELKEAKRMALKHSITRINDIANNLLNQFKPIDAQEWITIVEHSPLLVSIALLEIINEKKYEYQSTPVEFEFICNKSGYFTFINVDVTAFKCSISNIINNAVDAFTNKTGKIIIHIEPNPDSIDIIIEDNGKGMPKKIVDKIMNKVMVTVGKQDGHGIGLTQVSETLQNNDGKLNIVSKLGHGTKIILNFPKIIVDGWIADQILVHSEDIIIILDDDPSIHEAWKTRFGALAKKITIKHFIEGEEAIKYINSLNKTDKTKVLLLTDYELLKQELNGLNVVKQTKVERSILVTSHYMDKEVLRVSALTNTKILPKLLAAEIPIRIADNVNASKPKLREVDLVIVDDDKELIDNLKAFVLHDKTVDTYYTPQSFFDNMAQYPKNSKIMLDNYFPNSNIAGQNIAAQLHAAGFTDLYLFSGTDFSNSYTLPAYLKTILKTDIDSIKKLVK